MIPGRARPGGRLNRIRHLSIRVRLTAGALAIAAVFFAASAIVVRHQVESIITTSSVMLLQSDIDPFVQDVLDSRDLALENPSQGQLIAVIEPSGTVVQSTMPAELSPRLADLAAAGPTPQTVQTAAAEYSVISRTVAGSGGTWYIVAARNEAASRLSLDRLTTGLFVGLGLVTLLFAAGAWVLASAALRPVSAMRQKAVALRQSNSTDLLPVRPASDELRALAVTLNELITSLRASADREKQLVSDASHELRTPLAILQTQLELAHLSTGDADALLREIEAAERNVKRLSQLAAGLLELTRIEAESPRDEAPLTEMSDELVEAIDRARLLSTGRDTVVDYDLDASLAGRTGSIALSSHNFGRVVDNLLGNAISAIGTQSATGAGIVRADMRVVDAAGRGSAPAAHPAATPKSHLRLVVSDTGPGMEPDFVPLAFDRFTRQDPSRTSGSGTAAPTGGVKTGGAGLGLSIVAALVASAGGTVTLANLEPAGLSVTVELPVDPL